MFDLSSLWVLVYEFRWLWIKKSSGSSPGWVASPRPMHHAALLHTGQALEMDVRRCAWNAAGGLRALGGFMRRRAAGCGLHAVRAWTRVGLSRSYGHRVQAGGIVVKPRTMKWRFRLETRRLHTQASSLHLPYLSHLNSFQSHSYSCRRNSAFFHSSAWHPKVARPSRRRPAISPG